MKTMTSTLANQEFSKLLARAVAGEETTITLRGKAVAKLVPILDDTGAREQRKREHLEYLRKNPVLGATRGTRDELYDE